MKIRPLAVAFAFLPIALWAQDQPKTADTTKAPSANAAVTKNAVAVSGNADLLEVQQELQTQLKQKQFDNALVAIGKIPSANLTENQKKVRDWLLMFKRVDDDEAQNSSIFQKDDELDDDVKKTVHRLYKEAQSAFIEDKKDIGRDLLIHVIYLHRRNFKAKKLLEYAVGIQTGGYKVENMETKYWRLSQTLFYGGNYKDAIDALLTYSYIDKDNPETYERLGSNYYMLGDYKNAIESWTTALFLNPELKYLEDSIKKSKQFMEEDAVAARKRQERRETTKKQEKVAPTQETQLLGVFPNQTQAYNYAQKLKQQGLTAIVEELDNGKYAVKVPKTEPKKEGKK